MPVHERVCYYLPMGISLAFTQTDFREMCVMSQAIYLTNHVMGVRWWRVKPCLCSLCVTQSSITFSAYFCIHLLSVLAW